MYELFPCPMYFIKIIIKSRIRRQSIKGVSLRSNLYELLSILLKKLAIRN